MIIFARTRYEYASYQDFWHLVEISGFRTCFIDEIDISQDHTYIVTPMNGEVAPHLYGQAARSCYRAAKIIWWNLERPHDETLPSSMDTLEGLIDAVWVSDRFFATLNPRFTFVQLAGHQNYGMRTAMKRWDVCHLSHLWGRRLAVVDRLRSHGLIIAPEAWGLKEQNAVVAASHLMLSLHQDEVYPIIEPIRFAIAASYGIPIISEQFTDTQARDLVYASAPIEQIPEVVDRALRDGPSHLYDAGSRLFQRLCVDTDFRQEVERAAAAS